MWIKQNFIKNFTLPAIGLVLLIIFDLLSQTTDLSVLNMVYRYLIIIYYVATLIFHYYQQNSFLNIRMLFLFFFGIFLLSKFFTETLFGFGEVEVVRIFVSHQFQPDTFFETCAVLLLALTAVNFGFQFFNESNFSNSNLSLLQESSNQFYLIGSALMLLSVLPLLLFYLDQFFHVMLHGYYSYQLGNAGNKGPFLYLAEQLLWLGVAFVLAPHQSLRKILPLMAVLFVFFLIQIAIGRRGPSMVGIIFIVTLLSSLYRVRISPIFIIMFVCAIIFSAIIIGQLRHGRDLDIPVLFSLLFFFESQGSSVHTISYAIENQSKIRFEFLDIFADFRLLLYKFEVRLFGGNELSLAEIEEKFSYSGFMLTNMVDTGLLDSGKSIGSSFVAELYMAQGRLGVFVGSVLVAVFTNWLIKSSSRMGLMVGVILIPDILYLPRMSIGTLISYNLLALLIMAYLWVLPKRRISIPWV